MIFLPARTLGSCAGVDLCAGGVSAPSCAVEPVSASGAVAVTSARCNAHAENFALDLLVPGGSLGSPRRHRCPTSALGGDSFGVQDRVETAPDAMGLGLLVPRPQATGAEPTRSPAVAPIESNVSIDSITARFAGRSGLGGAVRVRGDFLCRGSTEQKVTKRVSAGSRRKSRGLSGTTDPAVSLAVNIRCGWVARDAVCSA
jgi:hypothetical protein